MMEIETYPVFKKKLQESNCQKCLLSGHRIHIVVDRGNYQAKVMILGEAPGESEDQEGRAFVGRAGRLLDKMMLEVDFDTNKESLIVNVVKCRPPDNRRPTKNEADACSEFLRKQFELIKPQILLLLGATAVKNLFPLKEKLSMKSLVGKFFTDNGYPGLRIMTLYHPAYLLRDPRKQPAMLEHLRTFKKYYTETILEKEAIC